MANRIILIYVDRCCHCHDVEGPARQLATEIGYEFKKRKPTLQELTSKRWSGGYPTLLLEWGGHSLELAGNKTVRALSRHKEALKSADLAPAQLAARLKV